MLAQRLGIGDDDILEGLLEPAEFPNAALGAPVGEEMSAQVITPAGVSASSPMIRAMSIALPIASCAALILTERTTGSNNPVGAELRIGHG